MTDAERLMWYHLRSRRFKDLKFRRQVVIGNYIVDFFCHEKKLLLSLTVGNIQNNVSVITIKREQNF